MPDFENVIRNGPELKLLRKPKLMVYGISHCVSARTGTGEEGFSTDCLKTRFGGSSKPSF